MKLKLSVAGGLLPVYKVAEVETAISDTELAELLSAIEIKGKPKTSARDAKGYTLEGNGKSVEVDPDLVPEKYRELFNQLMSKLKRVSL